MAIFALTFVSCDKNYTCVCTDATGGETKVFTSVSSRQAHANCTSTSHTEAGQTSSETCTLK